MSGGMIEESLMMGWVEPGVKEDGGHMISTVALRLVWPTP